MSVPAASGVSQRKASSPWAPTTSLCRPCGQPALQGRAVLQERALTAIAAHPSLRWHQRHRPPRRLLVVDLPTPPSPRSCRGGHGTVVLEPAVGAAQPSQRRLDAPPQGQAHQALVDQWDLTSPMPGGPRPSTWTLKAPPPRASAQAGLPGVWRYKLQCLATRSGYRPPAQLRLLGARGRSHGLPWRLLEQLLFPGVVQVEPVAGGFGRYTKVLDDNRP